MVKYSSGGFLLALVLGVLSLSSTIAAAPESAAVMMPSSPGRIVLYSARLKATLELQGTEKMRDSVIGDVDGDGFENELVYRNATTGGLGCYKIPVDSAYHPERDSIIPNAHSDAVPLTVVRWGYTGTNGIVVYRSASGGGAFAINANGTGRTPIGGMERAFAADIRQLGAKADLIWWSQSMGLRWRDGVLGTDRVSPWPGAVPIGGEPIVPSQASKTIICKSSGNSIIACDGSWNFTTIANTAIWTWSVTDGGTVVGDIDNDGTAEPVLVVNSGSPLQWYNVPANGGPWTDAGVSTEASLFPGWTLRGIADVDVSQFGSGGGGGTTPATSISTIRGLADGQPVNLAAMPRTKLVRERNASGQIVTTGFYIQQANRVAGIRVTGTPSASEGQVVAITGTMTTIGGEKAILASSQTTGSQVVSITPVATNIKSLYGTLSMLGLLVRITGSVSAADPTAGRFTLTDGSPQSVKVLCPDFTVTQGTVVVTGCVGAEETSPGNVVPVLRVEAAATGITTPSGTTPPPPAQSLFSAWTATSLDKVTKTEAVGASQTATVRLAKNEHESFQVVLRANGSAVSNVSVSVSNLTGTAGSIASSNVKVHMPWYINLPYYNKDVADPLPLYRAPFSLTAGQTQPLWIDVYVPKTAAAGDYSGTVTISASGSAPTTVPFSVHVYNFVLPDESKLRTLFDLNSYYMAPKEGVTYGSPESLALWKQYYEFLLDRGISPPDFPVNDFFSTEAANYMKDPRLTAFRIPYDANSTNQKRYFDQVKANGAWGKHYLDAVDEATHDWQYEQVRQRSTYYHGIDPTARVLTTYYLSSPSWAAPSHITDLLAGYTNIWCPFMNDQTYQVSRLAARRAAGDEVWTYVCTNPNGVLPNYFLQDPSISHRIIPWSCYLLDAAGWLYWHANYWNDVTDPWTDACTGKVISVMLYGEGSLLYPGKLHTGVAGPVSSVRLEVFRDGLEDYKYLWLLQQKIGRTAALTYVQKVIQGSSTYTKDKNLFYTTRDEIARRIEN